jgi:phosphatidylethanolamine-binding protein (PEBP) family uncharacterized protein
MNVAISNYWPLALITCLTLVRAAGGHDGSHDHGDARSPAAFRAWVLKANGAHVHGTFIALKDGLVRIDCDDGRVRALRIANLSDADQSWIADRVMEIQRLNEELAARVSPNAPRLKVRQERTLGDEPAIVAHFKPFEKSLELEWDEKFLFVGSNGMPEHPMMVGIRSWQQQVPLPQAYFGNNAWRIPLEPVVAENPLSTKGRFLRGAIAVAVNGVPIFNPLNNRGDDAFLAGELDEYGGHCGRADDYHYHLAPVHLEKTVGPGQPIAYALDGYPIYGTQRLNQEDSAPLDPFNGHADQAGNYHYHASEKYPYLNGGFHGVVTERDGQVDPQPRAEPVRPALSPLRGATITEFTEAKPGSFQLTYEVNGRKATVSYAIADDRSVEFTFVGTDGRTRKESYSSRKPRDRREDRPPRRETQPPESAKTHASESKFAVKSTSVGPDQRVSVDCTCDGLGQSPAVAWENAPQGTKSFAISMWHTAPDKEKSYWVVYNIPADTRDLKQNAAGVGTGGVNDWRRRTYEPICSQGPGSKTYHITVFALSEELKFAAGQATRAGLLKAIKGRVLAEATLDFQYERKK